jgi:glucose-1-phosphate cytidylyltransferase
MEKLIEIPVFILAGGLGTRLKEETEFRPKPMVPIGEYPILWHIMKKYRKHGFYRFIICGGYKSEVIKSYFQNYSILNSDFSVDFKTNETTIHSVDHNLDWNVTITFTGIENMTGSRIAIAAERFLGDSENFAVTYGDGLTDANLNEEYDFHLKHSKTGTILGVNPPSRFGEIEFEGDTVKSFREKPEFLDEWINGGFFFFRRQFLPYLSKSKDCILEKEPLVELAKDGELKIFKHSGFWGCMDTQRDRDFLNILWSAGKAPWTKLSKEE